MLLGLGVVLATCALTLNLRGAAVIDLRDFPKASSLLDVSQQCTSTFGIGLSQAGSFCTRLEGRGRDSIRITRNMCREAQSPVCCEVSLHSPPRLLALPPPFLRPSHLGLGHLSTGRSGHLAPAAHTPLPGNPAWTHSCCSQPYKSQGSLSHRPSSSS